ncbi:EAL domain-containing protein [Altererythrobacter sp. CC-YST694]|uniref:putative bifunctional diguanylate cyclase/phosphodiesterase n=1 Tax=Altererythrobacter sp. CC-YST694 TaxID=2755038 RepID=UPI001D006620|nr:EAL domain-containing protein [Altererythrobacter sp. CC-YST694]MCB5424957.1 EAL domain-containing protein [Altererythrobacter sp. CC-YST694]
MTDTHSDLPQLPLKLTNLAVIGVSQPHEGSWARLRALQYSRLEALSLSRFLAHAIALMLTLSIFARTVPPPMLAGWVLVLVAVLWNASRVDDGLRDVDRRAMTRHEYVFHVLSAALVAIVWAAPYFLFEPVGAMEHRLAFWAITAMLITGSTLAFAATPMATLIFAGITCGAAITSFITNGAYDYAAMAASFCGLAMGGAIRGARTYLSARIAEAGVAEKSEVVSLLLREFEDSDADWLWQIDTARRVRSASSRFVYALGKELDQIEGKSFVQLIAGSAWESGQFPPSLHDLAERLKRRESFSNLLVQVSIANGKRWWELSGTPMIDENGTFHGFRGVGSDVTEQRESDEKIAYLARYDTLTGLPNRLMLTEALGEALRYAEQWRTRCAFLMIDLDRFKAVNDSLGHQVGDQLLAQVSARLKGLMSENELVGRLGGDEFAIVIRDASDRDRVEKVATAVIDHLSLPYDVDHHTLYVGASVGSALGPRDGQTVETLMRNADLALYRAKDEGGSVHWSYEPSLHADAEERRQLEFALRQALDRGELYLQFQPVVDSRSETIVSFEALLRWNSAEHGFISPAKFIPLAEDTRLILPIGDWVLREACREALNWPGHVRVAVNVSGEQLLDPEFADRVVAALSTTGLPAHRLEIEVTESIFVRDAGTARATLEKIMALGCSVALDDFGTGYSSLGYLRTLRFSTIKVDRSFVQGAAKNNVESLAIIRAVVAMAQSLDMATTAEGVETAAEAAMIRELGCTKIQGYYFGRPMDAVDALALFRRGAAA